jgi:hypothetical protein
MLLSMRTYAFYIVIAGVVIMTGCPGEVSSNQKAGENTPNTPDGKPAPTKPTRNEDPGRDGPKDPIKDHVPDSARLDSLLFERFKEKGPQFVAEFKAPTLDENFFNRFFDKGKADAKLPVSDEGRRLLSSVLFPGLPQLKTKLQKERAGLFGGRVKASNNVLSSKEQEALGKLSADEMLIIDDVLLHIKDQLVLNDQLIADFEPYIFSGLKTDEKISKLYEGKDPLEVSKIHRGLYFSAALSVIQDINLKNQDLTLNQYIPYFERDSSLMIIQKRVNQVQKYVLSKIATL